MESAVQAFNSPSITKGVSKEAEALLPEHPPATTKNNKAENAFASPDFEGKVNVSPKKDFAMTMRPGLVPGKKQIYDLAAKIEWFATTLLRLLKAKQPDFGARLFIMT
jgi:hypothetical protein